MLCDLVTKSIDFFEVSVQRKRNFYVFQLRIQKDHQLRKNVPASKNP